MKHIFFTYESVKRQITDSISENLTDSDLERNVRIGKYPILTFNVKTYHDLLDNPTFLQV